MKLVKLVRYEDGKIYPIGVDYPNIAKLPTIDGISMQDNNNISHYGICSTESKVDEKIVQCKGFKLIDGARITVKFLYSDTSSNPKLKIEDTDAMPIRYGKNFIKANVVYEFIYIDGQYILLNEEVSALKSYINKLENTLASIENRLSILEEKNG